MSKLHSLIAAGWMLGAVPVMAQSLDDQINAVNNVQQRSEAAIAASIQQQADSVARQQRVHDAAVAASQKRNNGYVDQLRSLEIQRQQLELDAAKTRVSRENEFIDQELKENAAETDVVKAQAEASRNLSQGAKTYLENANKTPVDGNGQVLK